MAQILITNSLVVSYKAKAFVSVYNESHFSVDSMTFM